MKISQFRNIYENVAQCSISPANKARISKTKFILVPTFAKWRKIKSRAHNAKGLAWQALRQPNVTVYKLNIGEFKISVTLRW